MRILIAEDDRRVAGLLKERFARDRIAADVCGTGLEAVELAPAAPYDVLVLDIMMPEMDGLEAVRRLRGRGLKTPVLFLTARDAVEDRVRGLNAGADDYLVKPFAYEELLARVRALTRRPAARSESLFSVADLTLDADAQRVARGGQPIRLTNREYAILEYMMRNAGIVLSRERILDGVWSMDYEGVSNMVDVYIRNLRKKVDDPYPTKLIHTIRGAGYVLRAEG